MGCPVELAAQLAAASHTGDAAINLLLRTEPAPTFRVRPIPPRVPDASCGCPRPLPATESPGRGGLSWIQTVVAAAADSVPWRFPPDLIAGQGDALPLDLEKLRDSVDAFFAHLGRIGEKERGLYGSAVIVSWLAVATAVAFELARLRGRGAGGVTTWGAVGAEPHMFAALEEA